MVAAMGARGGWYMLQDTRAHPDFVFMSLFCHLGLGWWNGSKACSIAGNWTKLNASILQNRLGPCYVPEELIQVRRTGVATHHPLKLTHAYDAQAKMLSLAI